MIHPLYLTITLSMIGPPLAILWHWYLNRMIHLEYHRGYVAGADSVIPPRYQLGMPVITVCVMDRNRPTYYHAPIEQMRYSMRIPIHHLHGMRDPNIINDYIRRRIANGFAMEVAKQANVISEFGHFDEEMIIHADMWIAKMEGIPDSINLERYLTWRI
jgi:hypothetical protein